ncbi:MAG: alpha/beta hydrolase [Planctomycetes bacterium]|nr:alpha/beta hydrolase [Planctomycetota bacterium]
MSRAPFVWTAALLFAAPSLTLAQLPNDPSAPKIPRGGVPPLPGEILRPAMREPVTLFDVTTAGGIELWPGKAPSETGKIEPEKLSVGRPGQPPERVENVTQPTITIYAPPAEWRNGAAIIVAPGGGYRMLAWNKEGVEIAQWANSLGMVAAVLKYRVPRREGQPEAGPPLQPLQDAQRALSLLRAHASKLQIDPTKIGMIGFSAGGSLAANLSCNYAHRAYESIDDSDRSSCRPDFAALIYGGGIVDKATGKLGAQFKVDKQTPPMFFAVAGDDLSAADNSIQLYQAVRAEKLPAELHVYSRGGHGFGMRAVPGTAAATWPAACEQWLRDIAVLPAPSAASK